MKPFFTTFNDFLLMGGHGSYVWACYGLTLLAVVFGVWFVRHERKKFFKNINLQQARQASRERLNKNSQ